MQNPARNLSSADLSGRIDETVGQKADGLREGAAFPSPAASPSTGEPHIAILLCTYRGHKFLPQQLESFAAQTHNNWKVWASDDGSDDGTVDILETFKAKWGGEKLEIQPGPRKGFVFNFLALTCKVAGHADYYAFSDQDDIWDDNRLDRALAWLKSIPSNIPALYCSRTRLIDEENRPMGFSPLFSRPPSFANALVQNIGGGNTMVFNDAACRLIASLGPDIDPVIHDWWAYMVVTACGGQVHYDPSPSLSYRQHAANLVGVNSGWLSRFVRAGMIFLGRHKTWNDQNIRALRLLGDKLAPESRQILDLFDQARTGALPDRICGLKRSGVYRQTLYGSLGLIVAALFKKL